MIEYKCDRCGKNISSDWRNIFTVEFKPPQIWNYTSKLIVYPVGEYHFCEECVGKLQECIKEFGKSRK